MAATQVRSAAEQFELVFDILELVASCNREAAQLPISDPRSEFDSLYPPEMSLRDYCKNHLERFPAPISWPLVLIILERLCRDGEIVFAPINQHRLVLTACAIALKLQHDTPNVSSLMSVVGGVHFDELRCMEAAFLQLCDWRVSVPASSYDLMVSTLHCIKLYTVVRCATGETAHILPDRIVDIWDKAAQCTHAQMQQQQHLSGSRLHEALDFARGGRQP